MASPLIPTFLLKRVFLLVALTIVLGLFLGALHYYAGSLFRTSETVDGVKQGLWMKLYKTNESPSSPGGLRDHDLQAGQQEGREGEGGRRGGGGGAGGGGGGGAGGGGEARGGAEGGGGGGGGGEGRGGKKPQINQQNSAHPTEQSKITTLTSEHTQGTRLTPPFNPLKLPVELDGRPYRTLSPFEQEGANIVFTLRTTVKFHKTRLPLLMDTWMTKVNCSRIYLVTDGPDPWTEEKAKGIGMHYHMIECGKSYRRDDLCCKAGNELGIMFQPGNEHYDWLCHVDDDMYVFLDGLVKLLSKFDPKKDPVYLGRSAWDPRKVHGQLGPRGTVFYFGVGGMYCLSRPMLEEAKPYLVGGENFAQSCLNTREPEDVTVGTVVGAVLKYGLWNTRLITTHGLDIAASVKTFKDHVAVSYGYGAVKWMQKKYNTVDIPDALYSHEEDPSQFRSLHCHLYPEVTWCLEKRRLSGRPQEP